MISSRWPRPIGTIASIALRPVCSGSFTGWRSTTPGAMRSIGENCFGRDRALAVDRLAERVDDAAEQLVADRHRDDAAGALDRVAFLDLRELAEEHGADAVLFEVQRDAEHAVRELEHLAGHRVLDAVHARDAVADRDDAADFGDVDVDGEAADLVADDLGDLFGFDVHACLLSASWLSLDQRLFHLLQLRRDAAVVDRAADARDDAADDRRIDARLEHAPCGRSPAPAPARARAASSGASGDGGRHLARGRPSGDPCSALAIGAQRCSGSSTSRSRSASSTSSLRQRRGDRAGALEQRLDDAPASSRRNRRVRQHVRERLVPRTSRANCCELAPRPARASPPSFSATSNSARA